MQQLSKQSYLFGDFTLDLTRASLQRAGQEVRLRPKSFEALCYLVENPGRLIAKEELIQALWPDTFVTDDSLVKCLRDVRLALGDESNHYVKTVARKGYIFDVEVIPRGSVTTQAVYTEQIEGVRLVVDRTEHSGQTVEQISANNVSPATLSRVRSRTPRMIVVSVLVAALAAAAFLIWKKAAPVDPAMGVRSIAVLPFTSLSSDGNDNYLGLGMADTLITRLSGQGGIVVRPTSAVQKYSIADQDSLAAGREQKVDAVLEGSIQRADNRLRVTVRLLSVRDGSPLWAYKCDEFCNDIFEVQDAISVRVANALALKLTNEQRQRMAKRYTENVEAYELYIKGVFLRNQLTVEALKKSVQCFQKAIDLDPQYALAYAGQASSNSVLAYFGHIPMKDAESIDRALVVKALELDDGLAEAHAALGEFKLFIEWDWEGSERAFERALQLNPHEQLTNLLYQDLLLIKGKSEDAIALARFALETDPLSPRAGKALAATYFWAGKYDRAIEQYNQMRELFPHHSEIAPGPSYEQKGMFDEAIREYLELEARSGMGAGDIATLRHAYTARGWRGYWQTRLDLAKAAAGRQYFSSVSQAMIYARLGDKNKALDWLERAYAERDMTLVFIGLEPVFKGLRSEPRFKSVLQRLGVESGVG